jgi:chromosome segregation ATPase
MSEKIIEMIIGAVGAIFGGLLVYLSTRVKNKADAADAIADAAVSLLEPLKTRLAELEQHVTRQDREIKRLQRQLSRYAHRVLDLMNGIGILIRQIGEMNAKPCWEPGDWEENDDTG